MAAGDGVIVLLEGRNKVNVYCKYQFEDEIESEEQIDK